MARNEPFIPPLPPKDVTPLKAVANAVEQELTKGGGYAKQPAISIQQAKLTPEQSVAEWIVEMPYTNLKPMCVGLAVIAKARGKAPETFLDFVEILHTWALRVDNNQPIEFVASANGDISISAKSTADLVGTLQESPSQLSMGLK